jgi:NAD+ synthase
MTHISPKAPHSLSIAAAQINTKVGDVAGNIGKIIGAWKKAEAEGADLVVTPELSMTGYPLEDLVNNPELLQAAEEGYAQLLQFSKTMKSAILVGRPFAFTGGKPFNTAMLIENGMTRGFNAKHNLPNYDVFDEKRNFISNARPMAIEFRGVKIGVPICEDTWFPKVSAELAAQGAQVLISMNASPFVADKIYKREKEVVGRRVAETGLPMLYVNQVGGQDEVVFDGGSMAVNADGRLAYRAKMFAEGADLLKLDIDAAGKASFAPSAVAPVPGGMEQMWMALVTGTRDYLAKTGHTEVVLGMSGGIDSAVVAAIAADAIGPENVYLVSMPYKFSSKGTRDDARDAARMLGAPFEELPIQEAVEGLRKALGKHFNPASRGTANENDQARVRGQILMHISNDHPGRLVLSTGNKSEMSVGYCTLYGDMDGGFNPLKDVYKTTVRALAKWRNANCPAGVKGPAGPVMPDTIITRPPSAELADNQTDEQHLMPYEQLDAILQRYVEHDMAIADIAKETGIAKSEVERMVAKVDMAEFKRQQACPGVKITERAFGRGRRFPISRPTLIRMKDDLGGLKL